MIGIFKIKKSKSNLKVDDSALLSDYLKLSNYTIDDIYKKYKSSYEGLSNAKASKLLSDNGKNRVVPEDNKSWLYFFFTSFKDQFIIILVVLAMINLFLGDALGSIIILVIALISVLIRFFQDYSVYKFNKKLKNSIYSTTMVMRNNTLKEIKVENVVVGDIVKLNSGSIIPADVRIIECRDLFVNESVFTGESAPIEKSIEYKEAKEIFSLSNICLMGSTVISGSASGIIIKTGFDTYLGKIGENIDSKREQTNFELGMKKITNLLIKYMIFVCLFVLIVNGFIKHNIEEALLFALSVAVGITPSMLPMIVNVNLTKGSKSLAKKKTLVKRIESIQNLGAIDILCTDKTGTLTENKITLQEYIDVTGKENDSILEYAYLNSLYGTGMKNLVDKAIIVYGNEHKIESKILKYEKIDEIPFDYERKRMSVVVKNGNYYRMISKGALEEIIKVCSTVKINNKIEPINSKIIKIVNEKAKELAETGMQVIALAEKNKYPGSENFNSSYECEMTFVGFVGFLDPPKSGVKTILNKLKKVGVKTKILTGDNPYATKSICSLSGLNDSKILLGSDVDKMSDKELKEEIEHIDVFARLNPLQKERVVSLYKENGHVVGFMGDGVNDAPSLSKADIGISVNTATDIAKEASDIILLERNLNVIYDGIVEGRKVYGNIIKYMKMALSDDFGDVFSIMIASTFLPFLPLLPIQMLIQDFIYDISQIGIPYDNVDTEFTSKPKKWDTKGISRFMNVMGITSSVIDVIGFLIFWYVLGYNSINSQAYFQTAWFVTCLITELMIIYNVRTSRHILKSKPSIQLVLLTMVSIVLTILAPIALHSISSFSFVILPLKFYLYLAILLVLYFISVSIIKKIYIKRFGEWL